MPLNIKPDKTGFNERGDGLFALPFAEQIQFFQGKKGLLLPTEHWDDITGAAHDRAFMVAGAMKADLLADFHGTIEKAIAEGKSLDWFRKEFSKIVQRHGWDYTGAFDWRSRVIYQTNLQASYQAGRYAQLTHPDLLKNRPWWKYVHNDSVAHPRPLHVKWSGLTLKHDDPWWQTHFPPQGFGCRCRITAVAGPTEGRDTAPDDGTYEYVDRWGELHHVPAGVDYGWGYAPGANAKTPLIKLFADKLSAWPSAIGIGMAEAVEKAVIAEIKAQFSVFVDDTLAGGVSKNHAQLAGWIKPDVFKALQANGVDPATAGIYVEDKLLAGRKAERHQQAGDALTADEWKALPDALQSPMAVLLDNDNRRILYVFPSQTDSRAAKVAVEVDFIQGKTQAMLNMARSAFKIGADALRDKRKYTVLKGEV